MISFTEIRRYSDIDCMMNDIRHYNKEHGTYVENIDHPLSSNEKAYGWTCPRHNIYFTISKNDFNHKNNYNKCRYLDSPLKRKIASIYLSNCSTDQEYNKLKIRLEKLKAFF